MKKSIVIELPDNISFYAFFLVFGAIRPGILPEMSRIAGEYWKILNFGYLVWGIIGYVLTICVGFMVLDNIPLVAIPVFLQDLIILLSTIHNKGQISVAFRAMGIHIAMIILIEVFVKINRVESLLGTINTILGLYIIINLISIILYPNGMYINSNGWRENYFLGYKNAHIYFYLPYIFTGLMHDEIKYGYFKLKRFLMLFVMLYSTYKVDSITDFVIIVLLIMLFLIFRNRELPKFICIKNCLIGSILISAGFITFSLQSIFSNLIALIGRDVTFSRRFYIWTRTLEYILKRPVFGNGEIEIENIANFGTANHAHNMYLDLVFVGGIFALILFLMIWLIAERSIQNCNNYIIKNILIISTLGYFVLFITEAHRTNALIYMLVALCYCSDLIEIESYDVGAINNIKCI